MGEKNKSESKIQQEICKWYRNTYCLTHHNPRCMILSIPNESSQGRAMKLLQTGLYAGAADLMVVHRRICGGPRYSHINMVSTIFFETKDATGTQKPKQKKFEEHCKQMGIPYHIVRTLEEFQEIIRKL